MLGWMLAIAAVAGAAVGPHALWVAGLPAALGTLALGTAHKALAGRLALVMLTWTLGVGWGCWNPLTSAPPAPGRAVITGTVIERACDDDEGVRCRLVLAAPELEHGIGDRRSATERGLNTPWNQVTSPRIGAVAVGRQNTSWPRPVTVFAMLFDDGVAVGDVVTAEGELTVRRAYGNPRPGQQTPRPSFYIQADDLVVERDQSASWHVRAALSAREQLTFDDVDVTAVMRALLLGDRSGLEPELRWSFQDTGTTHLLAISGLHVGLIAWLVYALCRLLLLRWRWAAQGVGVVPIAAGCCVLTVWAFTLIIAPSDATRRAAVCVSLWLIGIILCRPNRARHALGLAAVVVAIAYPMAPLGPSYQLSFTAAAALVFAHPLLRDARAWLDAPGRVLGVRRRYLAHRLLEAVWVNVVATIATAPLGVAWFGQLAVAGLWVNLAAVPLLGMAVLPLALALVTVGPLLDLLWAPLRDGLHTLVELSAAGLIGLVTWAQGAVGSSHRSGADLWLCLGVTIVGLALLRSYGDGPRAPLSARLSRVWSPTRRWGAVLAALSLVLLVAGGKSAPEGLRMTAIDVGHGDAIVVQLPAGQTMLVDTGGSRQRARSSAELVARQLAPTLSQLGVASIDVLVITHADADHIGSARALASRVPVGELWLTRSALATDVGARLAGDLVRRGRAVRIAEQGADVSLGGAGLSVVWPPTDALRPDGMSRFDANDSSIVMRVDYAGRRLLLTGDIEAAAERELLASQVDLSADILKVAHHGSKTSSSAAFVAAVRPSVAIVSGVPGRRSMPPHRAPLQRLEDAGAAVWLTGRDGAITAHIAPDGSYTVSGYNRAHASTQRSLTTGAEQAVFLEARQDR